MSYLLRLDKIRFDLSTRVAEQQEKVVLLQSELRDSKKENADLATRQEEEAEEVDKEREDMSRQLQLALKVRAYIGYLSTRVLKC